MEQNERQGLLGSSDGTDIGEQPQIDSPDDVNHDAVQYDAPFPQPIPEIGSENVSPEEHQALLAQNNYAIINAQIHQYAAQSGTGLAAAAADEELYEREALANNEGPLLLPKCIRDVQGQDSAKLQRQHAGHFWIFNPPSGIYRSADLARAIGFTGSLYEKWTPKKQKYWDQKVQDLNQTGHRETPYPKGSHPQDLDTSIQCFVSYRWQTGRLLIWAALTYYWNSLPALLCFLTSTWTVYLMLSLNEEPCTKSCKYSNPTGNQCSLDPQFATELDWTFHYSWIPIWYCYDSEIRSPFDPGQWFLLPYTTPVLGIIAFFWFRQIFCWRSRVFVDKLCLRKIISQ